MSSALFVFVGYVLGCGLVSLSKFLVFSETFQAFNNQIFIVVGTGECTGWLSALLSTKSSLERSNTESGYLMSSKSSNTESGCLMSSKSSNTESGYLMSS